MNSAATWGGTAVARVFLHDNLRVFYAVDGSVGTGCINGRRDVLLVQYFLRVAMEPSYDPGFVPPGEQPIEIDGICGSQTSKYIRFFQEETIRRGYPIIADGRVDPLHSGDVTTGSPVRLKTLWYLNQSHFGRRLERHYAITRCPGFPPDLGYDLQAGG
jgi:hypothetical protein